MSISKQGYIDGEEVMGMVMQANNKLEAKLALAKEALEEIANACGFNSGADAETAREALEKLKPNQYDCLGQHDQIKALAKEVEQLQMKLTSFETKLSIAKDALEYYSDYLNWHRESPGKPEEPGNLGLHKPFNCSLPTTHLIPDRGRRAREALEKLKLG